MAGAKGKAKGKARSTKQQSRSERAGLHFPVGRVARFLKEGGFAQRVGDGASVYLAAVLEYLTAEILELSGNAAKQMKKSRIVPRCIYLAIKEDPELDRLLGDAIITNGGAKMHIDPFLVKARREQQQVVKAN